MSTDAAPTTSLRNWLSVIIVGVSVFTVTTTEMTPMGVLPAIAHDLHVSEGQAGLSVTLYGVLAGLLAPIATVITGRIARRTLLLTILATFTAGNALSALAHNYLMFMASRFISGLIHGLMWAIVASIAIRLVADKDGVRATAAVFSGISLALVLGVPLTSFIGSIWGWRTAFALLAALSALSFILVRALLPALPSRGMFTFADLRSLTHSRELRNILLLTGTAVIGNYAAYTYIAPYLEHRNITPGAVGFYLLGYGIAGVLGNFLSGALLSRSLSTRTLLISLTAAMTAALTLVGFSRSEPLLFTLIAAWGLVYSAIPVALQTLILRTGQPRLGEAKTSLYVLVFNCSIAAGALAGAVGIDAGGPLLPIALSVAFSAAATTIAATSRGLSH